MNANKKLENVFQKHLHNHQLNYQRRSFDNGVSYIYDYAQKGKTWFCACEGLLDAYKNGRDQLFVAPTMNQSFISIHCMNWLLHHVGGKELPIRKPVIELDNGSKLRFLSTGVNQQKFAGFHGNVYFDNYEFFPKDKACDFYKVGRAISAHKDNKLTLIDRILEPFEG